MTEQLSNLNEQDNLLIKKTFAGNEQALQLARAVMFGLPTSEQEREIVRATFNLPGVIEVFKKKLLPQLDKQAPIGQVSDVWLGAEQMVFGQQVTAIRQAIQYKKIALEMTEQAIALLQNPEGDAVDLSIDYEEELGIRLLARNQYIRHIEQQLVFIKIIAEMNEDTEKQIKEKRLKDSAR